MTWPFSTYVVLVWLTVVLTVPAAIGCLIATISIDRTALNTHLFMLLPLLSVAFTLWTLFMRLHSQRVMIRAGAWPAWCMGDRTPRVNGDGDGDALKHLRTAVLDIRRRTGKTPNVVGSGWGFFLKRSGPSGPRLFMHNFTGRMPTTYAQSANKANAGRWAAGTTIAQVQRELKKQGLVLPSTPTMDYITLASWFTMANHGNGGAPGMGKSDTLVGATLLDMETDTVTRDVKYADIRRIWDTESEWKKFVVVDVQLKAEADVQLQKKGILVKDAQSAADWLAPTKLRVLFCGAARSYGIGVRWQAPYEETTHIDPHFCSRYCLYFQTDIFSAVLGWHESMKNYKGKIMLSDATRWMPEIFQIELIGAVLLGVINFEIIVETKQALTGESFWRIVEGFINMHKEIGGRCEFRTNGGAGAKLFIDCGLQRGFDRPFKLLKSLGFGTCALHPGKYIVSTIPLKRITLAEMNGVTNAA